jgi:glyoxylase-like metal-dependent hydrolase (beta-lactamase superfamily II)
MALRSTEAYSGEPEIEAREIGEGVFVAGNGETRILYVEFEDHFVAMEAGGMPEYARMTYEAMKPHMGDKPLRYIIPTHHHDDHAFAVHFYARIGATILTTRDKEGFMRILLGRTWGDDGPVRDAKFEFIDGSRRILDDETNRLDILVYHDGPHTENMLVGYVPSIDTLFTADIYIGWAGESVRQGASYSARHLLEWTRDRQRQGHMGEIEQFVSVHGKAYSKAEMNRMLSTERVIVTLPDNDAWPSASWFLRFGLSDDTTGEPRRGGVVENPAMM